MRKNITYNTNEWMRSNIERSSTLKFLWHFNVTSAEQQRNIPNIHTSDISGQLSFVWLWGCQKRTHINIAQCALWMGKRREWQFLVPSLWKSQFYLYDQWFMIMVLWAFAKVSPVMFMPCYIEHMDVKCENLCREHSHRKAGCMAQHKLHRW